MRRRESGSLNEETTPLVLFPGRTARWVWRAVPRRCDARPASASRRRAARGRGSARPSATDSERRLVFGRSLWRLGRAKRSRLASLSAGCVGLVPSVVPGKFIEYAGCHRHRQAGTLEHQAHQELKERGPTRTSAFLQSGFPSFCRSPVPFSRTNNACLPFRSASVGLTEVARRAGTAQRIVR